MYPETKSEINKKYRYRKFFEENCAATQLLSLNEFRDCNVRGGVGGGLLPLASERNYNFRELHPPTPKNFSPTFVKLRTKAKSMSRIFPFERGCMGHILQGSEAEGRPLLILVLYNETLDETPLLTTLPCYPAS